MQISQIVSSYNTSSVKENVKSEISLHKDEKEVSKKQPEISNLSAKEISNSYFLQYQKDIAQNASSNLLAQGGLNFSVPENLSDILAGLDLAGIGYNGKALSGCAGTCRLNCRIQGQNIGLEGNVINGLDDFTDFIGL